MGLGVLSFPLLENLLMRQHATAYWFDQVKLVPVLLMLIFISLHVLRNNIKYKYIRQLTVFLLIGISAINVYLYKNTDKYLLYRPEYFVSNCRLSNAISPYIAEGVLAQKNVVRGYDNLLFHHGIYELVDENFEQLNSVKRIEEKRYIIYLDVEECQGNMDRYKGAWIYDKHTGRKFYINA